MVEYRKRNYTFGESIKNSTPLESILRENFFLGFLLRLKPTKIQNLMKQIMGIARSCEKTKMEI